jgi:hypothetical protein
VGGLGDQREAAGAIADVRTRRVLWLAYAVALSLVTVWAQVYDVGGTKYLEGAQILRHRDVLDATAFDPWTYRVLSELVVDAAHRLLALTGVPKAWPLAFVGVRGIQNVAIFLLAALYYRRLGLTRAATAFGLGLIAWGLLATNAHTDLKFDTWTDVIFYLVAALIVLSGDRWFPWIIPLTALAAVNRETAGLIPVMLGAVAVQQGLRTRAGQRTALIAAASLAVFAAVYFGMRQVIGDRPLFVAYAKPGLGLLRYNLTHFEVWHNLFATFAVLPAICVYAWPRWSRPLRTIAIAIVPAWVIAQFVAGIATETRLFVVPDVLVFVPGALVALVPLERRIRKWGVSLARDGAHSPVARAFAVAAGVVLAATLAAGWYSQQRVIAPFSAARPGPQRSQDLWAQDALVAAALAAIALLLVVLALARTRFLAVAGITALGIVACALVYRQLTAVPGLHYYPRPLPSALAAGFNPAVAGHTPPRIVPAHPPDVANATRLLPAAYLAASAAVLAVCAGFLSVVSARDRAG